MKLYMVTLETQVVVMAEDEMNALRVAQRNAHDAVRDDEPTAYIARQLESIADLSDGWDGDSVPYGSDRNKRIKDLLTP